MRIELMKKISIGICCYNEEGNVRETYNAIKAMLETIPQYNYEIVFEDNASKDKTQEILREIAVVDKKVKIIFNKSNFGAERSATNLLQNISGDVFVGLPCDLQEPVDVIPEFLKYWEQGYDIVWGQKTKSKESKIKYLCRNLYYNIMDFFSEYKVLHQTTGFGVMDRSVIEAFCVSKMQDPYLEMRNWVMEFGYSIKLVPYVQNARKWGKSSYSARSYYNFAINSLCSTSIRPLRMMSQLGLISGVCSVITAIIYFIYKITHWYTFQVGIAPLIIGLFLCMSIQLFSIGILGEYIGIIMRRITKKPVVIEKERINFDENQYKN